MHRRRTEIWVSDEISTRGTVAYIVDEPNQRYNKEPETIIFEHERVWGLDMFHRVTAELLRLLELQTKDEQYHWEDDTDTETRAPNSFVVDI